MQIIKCRYFVEHSFILLTEIIVGSRKELQDFCGFKSGDHFRLSVLLPLISARKIDLTIPDKPQSPKQRYFRHE
ncbi:Fic family protein [Butyrivibrio sp. MC2013]|uniref:Fic family protein n=1 Tax=Butyrivibrio sp. MC2013 TaxID=1280686 RepID=UPI003FA4120F